MNKYLVLILVQLSLIIPSSNDNTVLFNLNEDSCIQHLNNREIIRNNFTVHETIQSENFVIHFTTSDIDSQYVNGQWFNLQSNETYAQSIIDHAEAALEVYLNDGWVDIPPDCDESITDINSPNHCINFGGNSLYDIYISNDAVGMVVPESPYPVEPYLGGYTSFMKISTLLNQHDTLPTWSYHVVAHELHHSIQLRYGYSVSGEPGNYMYNGWFFEQSATYMENVIYPESIHLRTMLSNCDVVTPLTYPEYNIDYPTEIYPYRSALWQKFLVESLGDSSIVRYIWEDYGSQYSTGDIVSLFPIYNDAIEQVTNENKNLSDAYFDYSLWRYFTGERSINNMFFDDSANYCSASIVNDYDSLFVISSNKGAAKYIELPFDNMIVNIESDYPNDINFTHLILNSDNSFDLTELSFDENQISFEIFDNNNFLIVNSNYDTINSVEMPFSISFSESFIIGDLNNDSILNVLDIVMLVDILLLMEYNIIGDINSDDIINILDIVQLVQLII